MDTQIDPSSLKRSRRSGGFDIVSSGGGMRGTAVLLVMVSVALGGCFETPQERAQKAAATQVALDAREDKICQSYYGLRPGTDQYAACRIKLVEGRNADPMPEGDPPLTAGQCAGSVWADVNNPKCK